MAQYFQVMLDNISPHPLQKTSIKIELDLKLLWQVYKESNGKETPGAFHVLQWLRPHLPVEDGFGVPVGKLRSHIPHR